MGVLDEIVANKREELQRLRGDTPQAQLETACRGLAPTLPFESVLRPSGPGGVRLIAEVKKASPSRGTLNAALDPVVQARLYAGSGAAAISVLTDQKYFRGALERASASLSSAGAKRLVRLRVSAAFHSPAMRPVGDALATECARLAFRDARIPVVSNVDAAPHSHAPEFAPLLARQAYSAVRWVAAIRRMEAERVDRFVEFGAGSVLTGLVKRIIPGARAAAVQDPRSLEEAAPVLG